ncbi:hypothetical protein ACLK19_20780 [Escherichia coli]
MHDTDRSAWWALFLIPFIGWLIIVVALTAGRVRSAKTALDQSETGTLKQICSPDV